MDDNDKTSLETKLTAARVALAEAASDCAKKAIEMLKEEHPQATDVIALIGASAEALKAAS